MSWKKHLAFNRLSKYLLLLIGIVLVVLSSIYVSSYLAIFGSALIFWSIILFYITPSRHVPLGFLDDLSSTLSDNIERLLTEFDLTAKGIYLPPRNLQDIESSVVFIPKKAGVPLPTPEKVTEKIFSKEREGLLLTPPGFGLSQLFEKEANVSFTKIDFTYLQRNLPKVAIDILQIADNVELDLNDNLVTIKVTDSIFNETCRQASKQPRSHAQVGCLLASAFACVLAKAIGKPIVLESEVRAKKTLIWQFSVLAQ